MDGHRHMSDVSIARLMAQCCYSIVIVISVADVYDFGQNMAGQVTLTVHDCPEGTVIVMRHGEILYPNGSVHNHYLPGASLEQ